MMAVMTVSVSADQDGYNNWCNMDQYGCWVTGDEGEQIYIMFWSEAIRQQFMGDSTAPYKNVQDRCVDCTDGKLPLSKSLVKTQRGLSFSEWAKQCEARGKTVVFDHTDGTYNYYLCK